MSNSDSDEDVQLYSALKQNQKRKVFAKFSSSESEDDEVEERLTKRKRRANSKTMSSPEEKNMNKAQVIDADADEDDEVEILGEDSSFEDLLTPAEREAERLRKLEIEIEINKQLARDKLLVESRAIMSKTSSFQSNTAQETVDLLDSDDDSENGGDVEILQTVSIALDPPASTEPATAWNRQVVNRGERIKLHVRSNGEMIDEIDIHMNDTFDALYTSFCDVHGLPRSAVVMSLDGETLKLTGTPELSDLESGDLIEAKVDFSQQVEANIKRYLRLRLVMFGRRSELFKIGVSSTVRKLHASYCQKHHIEDPSDVVMSVNGEDMVLDDTIDRYGLSNDDEVLVRILSEISVRVRYEDGSSDTESVLLTEAVQVLLQRIATRRHCALEDVTLRIDGEPMSAFQTFKHYDLEGDELLDVKIKQ